MMTGNGPTRFFSCASRLANSAFVALLLVVGLLMTPVSCTCGASVPHGHSLFQLPFHHHGSVDAAHDYDLHTEHPGTSIKAPGPAVPAATAMDLDCDGGAESHRGFAPSSYVALSNIAEKQDGAALKAPPSSSIGQPISISQPSVISLAAEKCESITLPPVRTLEGTETSPETPPPKLPVLV